MPDQYGLMEKINYDHIPSLLLAQVLRAESMWPGAQINHTLRHSQPLNRYRDVLSGHRCLLTDSILWHNFRSNYGVGKYNVLQPTRRHAESVWPIQTRHKHTRDGFLNKDRTGINSILIIDNCESQLIRVALHGSGMRSLSGPCHVAS